MNMNMNKNSIPHPHSGSSGTFHLSELASRTSQLASEMGFFQRVLLKNHLLRAYYLGFDWSGWIVLIKSEILITMGMVWPVSSGKWKALFVCHSWLKWNLEMLVLRRKTSWSKGEATMNWTRIILWHITTQIV